MKKQSILFLWSLLATNITFSMHFTAEHEVDFAKDSTSEFASKEAKATEIANASARAALGAEAFAVKAPEKIFAESESTAISTMKAQDEATAKGAIISMSEASASSSLSIADQMFLQLQKWGLQAKLLVSQVAYAFDLGPLIDATPNTIRNQLADISSQLGHMKDVVTYMQSIQKERISYWQELTNKIDKGMVDIAVAQQGIVSRINPINQTTVMMNDLLRGMTPANLAKYQATMRDLVAVLADLNDAMNVKLKQNRFASNTGTPVLDTASLNISLSAPGDISPEMETDGVFVSL